MCDLAWLPRLMLLADFGGDWVRYREALYACFRRDFMCVLPKFQGHRMQLKYLPEIEGKCGTFWHFISEGREEANRLPDMRRCERIEWPRCLLDEATAGGPRVHLWSNARRTERRWVIAVTDFSYVLVLAERGSYVLPWTAYCVEYPHRRDQLRREYEAATEARKS